MIFKRNFQAGCLCLILCSAISCFAKEWRGIAPLRSTRADVIERLGNPKKNQDTGVEYFDLGTEKVTIQWIDPTCERKYPVEPAEAVRPAHVVLRVTVFPKTPINAKELDLLPMMANANCLTSGECTISNGEEGIAFSTSRDGVTQLSYYPPMKEFKAWIQGHKACSAG